MRFIIRCVNNQISVIKLNKIFKISHLKVETLENVKNAWVQKLQLCVTNNGGSNIYKKKM